jgi:Ni/Co efflux regulator RcnB
MFLKLWFRAGTILATALALCTTIAVAQGNGHGHDKHDRDDDRSYDQDRDEGHGHGHGHGEGHGHGNGHGRYHDHDREIHDWYRTHYSHLPPGLAKRDRLPPGLERQLVVNGTLPPGLRRKMQPCPHELEVMLPPPPPNYAHVVIGGNLVLVNRVSFQVADVFHFDATF